MAISSSSSISDTTGPAPASSLQAARLLAEEIVAQTRDDETLDVQQILHEHPELDQYHSVVVDLVYEQFLREVDAGRQVAASDLAKQFPRHQESLLRLFHVHEHLDLEDLSQRPQWPTAPGSFLGFDLIEEIGRGSFSRVFLATDPAVGDRKVVVKVTTHAVTELSTLGNLDHPNVVPVFSARRDPDSDLTAICMPYQSRSTLFDAIQHSFGESLMPTDGRVFREATLLFNAEDLSKPDAALAKVHERPFQRPYVEAVLHIGLQLAEALAYTHERGILHCDIKPSNILLTTSGRAMLFDFNLAFLQQAKDDAAVRGTLAYMAPEQLRAALREGDESSQQIDGRTDIFSFGVTLYQLLCGKLPFDAQPADGTGRSFAREQLAMQRTGPPPLSKLIRQVDAGTAKLIERCLEFEPEKRPQTAQELVAALRQQLSAPRRLKRWARERRKLLCGIGFAAVAVVGIPTVIVATTETLDERLLREGWEHYHDQDFEQALLQFQRAVERQPSNADALYARARAYMQLGEYEMAERDLSVVEERFSNDGRIKACIAHCVTLLAFSSDDRRGFRNAAVKYEQAIALGFESEAVYNNLGYCYLKSGRSQNAGIVLQIAIQNRRQFPASYHNLAKVELMRERNDLPNLEFIQKAIQIGPPSAELFFDAAKTYALAANRASNSERHNETLAMEFEDKLLDYCRQALDKGLPVESLNRVENVYPRLKDLDAFQNLVRGASPKNNAPMETARVIDPLKGLVEPIELGAVASILPR